MDYTGENMSQSPPQFRELRDVTIGKISVGSLDSNAYLVRDRATGIALLIDAAADAPRLHEFMNAIPHTTLAAVLTTHRHSDHWQALRQVVEDTNARTIAHPADAAGLPVPTEQTVRDHDHVEIGHSTVEIIHLVGHTPGSIAVLYQDPGDNSAHLFTGDSLFPGGVGNTFGKTELFRALLHDVETKIFDRLPDDTWVYPGHGNDTTLGAERPYLDEWRARGW